MSDSVQDEGLVRVIGTGVIALLTFLAAVNVRGVKAGMRLYIFNTLAKLVPLLLLLGAGLFVTNVENLAIPEWPSAASIGASTNPSILCVQRARACKQHRSTAGGGCDRRVRRLGRKDADRRRDHYQSTAVSAATTEAKKEGFDNA